MADHPFTEDDLLAYVRGAASAELSARIEALAQTSDAFRAEIALMHGLGPALRATDQGQPPNELGWRRLEGAIKRGNDASRRTPAPGRLAMLRAAAVFLGFVVLGQGVYIAAFAPSPEAPAFRTASTGAQAHVLAVAFAADARADGIERLLREAEAQIVGGPSAIGLYRLAFTSEAAMSDARAALAASPLLDLIADE
jgi:anti-sigma factor RsiW